MAREIVAKGMYGGCAAATYGRHIARLYAEADVLRKALVAGYAPETLIVEDGERDGDYTKLYAYRKDSV